VRFRTERETLADAVAWAARSLPARTTVPVLAGLLLEISGQKLSVSGFDYEVSAQVDVDVDPSESGRVLVPGRLLADITRSLPAQPVEFATEGSRVTVTCGTSSFALPTMPVDEYPTLPELPEAAGTLQRRLCRCGHIRGGCRGSRRRLAIADGCADRDRR